MARRAHDVADRRTMALHEETTARLLNDPSLVDPSTRGATGWCFEIHDFLVSKYVANREKDRRFARAAIRHGMVTKDIVLERLGQIQLAPSLLAHITGLVLVDFGDADPR